MLVLFDNIWQLYTPFYQYTCIHTHTHTHSHINRITSYENPVIDAMRRYAGSQLPQRGAYDDRPLPPMKEPPNIQSTAALEKQREAEAAAMWPDAGLVDHTDSHYPYPYQQPSEQDLEAQLQGEVIKVALAKTASGFGFTIIGGDRPGELLQIKSIVKGSTSDRDGRLSIGDVLVRINGISVLSYSHRKVVELFQTLPLNSQVIIEVRRGYPLPNFQNDELPTYNDSNRSYGEPMPNSMQQNNSCHAAPPPERVMVSIVKGPLGFGFSLGEYVFVS